MSFRKTGSMTGSVTEVEQIPGALSKVAVLGAWGQEDEAGLVLENETIDSAPPGAVMPSARPAG